MSAFVVFGVSMADCKIVAAKKVRVYNKELKRDLTQEEHAAKIDALAHKLFGSVAKPKPISAAFDAPQFARDYIDVAGRSSFVAHSLKVMVRKQKTDTKGLPMTRKNGGALLTWVEYAG